MNHATLLCIQCDKKAISWTGHVHINGRVVIAGWCSEHVPENREQPERVPKCKFKSGCYGESTATKFKTLEP